MYSFGMYQIRIRTNKRVDELGRDDTAIVGVRLKSGEFRYLPWHGFTLHIERPVKLLVEAFTLEPPRDPRVVRSAMPRWHRLREGEFLLGSYSGGRVTTFLPFTIVTETHRDAAHAPDGGHRGTS